MDTTQEESTEPVDSVGEDIAEMQATAPDEDKNADERANLARFMNAERQKAIVVKALDRYERDLASRQERMKKLRELQEMYALVSKPKNFPFHRAANVKTPTLTGPNLQIQARLYDMILPRNGKLFYAIPGGSQEQSEASIAEQFANSYVRYRMPYMSQGLDDTLHQMTLYGSSFRRTYWDGYTRRVASDWIPIDDFVAPYSVRSQDPSMSDVSRYTMVHHMTMHDLRSFADEGVFINVDEVKGSARSEGRSEFAEAAAKIDGVSPDDDDEDASRKVLEQHCVLKLPNSPGVHPAFDGKSHYVVITIEPTAEKMLRLSLREEDDPDDKRRFDRDTARFQQYQVMQSTYNAALDAYRTQQAAFEMAPQQGASTIAGPMGVGDAQMMMGGPPQPQPPMHPGLPPQPVPPPRPIRRRQICFFTHYRCFPGEGFYGLGYGDLLYGLALAQNTIINQHIDGVTLRNAKPMFMSRQVRMQRGSVNVQPGEAIEIDGPVSQIKDSIMFLDPPQNDPTTVPLIKMLDGMRDVLSGSADLMSGQVPGSNQTRGGMEILAEQAMTPITVLARRVMEAFRHELDKIWRCFGVFLDDAEIADVIGDDGKAEQMQIGRAMFQPTARLVPTCDPRMKSQRAQDFQQLFGFVMQNPFIQQGPAAPVIMRKMTEDGLRIFGGDAIVPLLPQIPPPPQGPPPPQPSWAENAGFLQKKPASVNPADDDDEHTQAHMAFLSTPDAQVLDKNGRAMAEDHIRQHRAAAIMKKGQQFEQAKQAFAAGSPGGGSGAMEGSGSFPALSAALGAGA